MAQDRQLLIDVHPGRRDTDCPFQESAIALDALRCISEHADHERIAPGRGARHDDGFLGQPPALGAPQSDAGWLRTGRSGVLSLPMPPIPRHFELGRPHAATCPPRLVLLVDIAIRIAAIGDRLPVADHHAVEVFASLEADSQGATIAVRPLGFAGNRPPADPVNKVERGLATTRQVSAVRAAGLTQLRCIDPVEADAAAIDLDVSPSMTLAWPR